MNSFYKQVDETLTTLNRVLEGNNYFLTTSFGRQSSLLLFIFNELGIKPSVLFINSPLIQGRIETHKERLQRRFSFDLTEIDKTEHVFSSLKTSNIESVSRIEIKKICKDLKKDPLKRFIEDGEYNYWISAIRRDQTEIRKNKGYLELTDLGVVKVNPLINWSDNSVYECMRKLNLPENKDYKDLCKEINERRECGLHT